MFWTKLTQERQAWMLPHRETLFGHLQAALETTQVVALLCMAPTQADDWFLVSDAVPVIRLNTNGEILLCLEFCAHAQTAVASIVGPALASGLGFLSWPPLMCLISPLSPTSQLWLQVSVILILPLLAVPVMALSRFLSLHVTWKGEWK